MKRRLLQWRDRIDALKMRERVALFFMMAALIVFIASAFALDPLFARKRQLQAELNQQNDVISAIDAEITAAVDAHQRDPDAAARARLAAVKAETGVLAAQLRTMQSKLVPAEHMANVVGSILRDNGRLRLESMKTLPMKSLLDASAEAGAPARPASLIYRHAVEVTVRGNYLDMVDYMTTLEAMPVQLFWSHAQLSVEKYPDARLTLTLYTLSLDQKWMTL